MEQETKKCPYCGEEILAEAKKCKHCGEWLEPKGEQNTESTPSVSENQAGGKLLLVKRVKEATGVSLAHAKEAVDATGDFYKAMEYIQEKGIVPQEKSKEEDNGPIDVDIPIFAKIAFWVASIGAFIVMVNETGMHSGAGKLRGIIEMASWLPSWLGSLLDTIGYVGLLSLLMVLAKKLGKPVPVFCGMSIALNILLYIVEVSIDEESLIGLFTLVFSSVIIIILGITLIVEHRNALKELGIALVVFPLVTIFVGFIMFYYFDAWETSVAACALSIAFYYIFKDCLIKANDEPKTEKNSEILLVGGIGLIIAIIPFFFVTCGSSDSPSYNNAEGDTEMSLGTDDGVPVGDAASDEMLNDSSGLVPAESEDGAVDYQITLQGKIWDEDAILVLHVLGDKITGTCTYVSTANVDEVTGEVEDSEGTITIGMGGSNSSWTFISDDSDMNLYHCVQYVFTAGGGEIDGGVFKVLERK